MATFKGMEQFLANSLCLDKGTPVFVDIKLSGKERGDLVSERPAKMGFGLISLAAGLKFTVTGKTKSGFEALRK